MLTTKFISIDTEPAINIRRARNEGEVLFSLRVKIDSDKELSGKHIIESLIVNEPDPATLFVPNTKDYVNSILVP